MRKRVLYIFPLAANFTLHWIDRVRKVAGLGIDVHVAVPDCASLDGVDLDGVTLHRFKASRTRRGYDLRFLWETRRVIRSVKPDLVHAATTRPVVYAGIFARLAGVQAVVLSVTGLGYLFTEDRPLIRMLRAVGSLAYRFALRNRRSHTVFENPADRDEFVSRGFVPSEQTSVFLGGGIDLEQFAYKKEPPTNVPLALFVGRLLKDKGVVEFLEAARTLQARGVSARFILAGDVDPGNPASLTAATVEQSCANSGVEWIGWCDDMVSLYERANLVCLPSYREGASRTIIEAAAIGRAVVATDVPGCRDLVIDGVTGRLVPKKAVVPLADAMQELLENADDRGEMGTRARELAEEAFSSESRAVELIDLYQRMIGPIKKADRAEQDAEELRRTGS